MERRVLQNLYPLQFHLRGSQGRLGQQIFNFLLSSVPEAVGTKTVKFGGSFGLVTSSGLNSESIFILASGKSTANSSQFECENEFSAFQQTMASIENSFRSTGIKCLVYVSSGGSVYGPSDETKFESSPLNPISPYAFQKIAEEQEVMNLALKIGARLLILRLANAFSADATAPKGLIDSLLAIVPGATPLELYVNPSSKKQYGLFSDYAEAIIYSLSDFLVDSDAIRVQNIFSANTYSIQQIIQLVSDARKVLVQDICNFHQLSSGLPDDSVILGSRYTQVFPYVRWKKIEELIMF
jgi:nucleoside-diphosphate-sugar epimerase